MAKQKTVTIGARGGPRLGRAAVAKFMRVAKARARQTGQRVVVRSFAKGSAKSKAVTFGARGGVRGGAGAGGG